MILQLTKKISALIILIFAINNLYCQPTGSIVPFAANILSFAIPQNYKDGLAAVTFAILATCAFCKASKLEKTILFPKPIAKPRDIFRSSSTQTQQDSANSVIHVNQSSKKNAKVLVQYGMVFAALSLFSFSQYMK